MFVAWNTKLRSGSKFLLVDDALMITNINQMFYGDHQSIINYQKLGTAAQLSIPSF